MGKATPDPDKVGMFASSICAIHCVLVAVFLGLLPSVSSIFHSVWIDVFFIAIAFIAGSFAVVQGYRRHRVAWLPPLFFIGFGLLCASVLRHAQSDEHASPPYLSILGGCLLVTFHWFNRKMRQPCVLS